MSSSLRSSAAPRFRLSVLDRLCLDEDAGPLERDPSVCDWSTFRACLLRDLSQLLNTRVTLSAAHLRAFPAAGASVLGFGLPEVSRTGAGDERAIDQLGLVLTEVLLRFEPRISRPRVSSIRHLDGDQVLFRLEAEVAANPAPIRLVFDTTFNVEAGSYTVEGGHVEG